MKIIKKCNLLFHAVKIKKERRKRKRPNQVVNITVDLLRCMNIHVGTLSRVRCCLKRKFAINYVQIIRIERDIFLSID